MKAILALSLLFANGLAHARTREWTVLFYVAADEPDIKIMSRRSLKLIESVPALGDGAGPVSVVAQIDEAGDDPNYRYLLRHVAKPSADQIDTAPIPEADVARIEPGFHYGEKDSGSPATLKAFLNWGVRAYPARHYLVILGGHSWGQQGLMQDFFVDGKELESSTLIKNYEVRRVFEEVARENPKLLSRGKFDALMIDACTSGQLDVALEYQDVVDYYGATNIETPLYSQPYDRTFQTFITAVRSWPGVSIEDALFRPWVKEYLKAHSPGGALAKLEGMVSPVSYFVVRTAELGRAAGALKDWVKNVPPAWREKWLKEELPAFERVADGDDNADLATLARVSERLLVEDKATVAAQSARRLRRALVPYADPAMKRTALAHSGATGAWVHIDVETTASSWRLAVCQNLKGFSQANAVGGEDFLPHFWQKVGKKNPKEEPVLAEKFQCDELLKEDKSQEVALAVDKPVELKQLLGLRIEWPSAPAYASLKADGRRELSVWIPAKGAKKLARRLFLRGAGSPGVRVEYFADKAPLGEFTERFPTSWWRAYSNGLYVVEGHSAGTHFKQGLGIFLGHELQEDGDYYQWGKLPLGLVEKAPYGQSTEAYEAWFAKLSETEKETYVRKGWGFYRLHRFAPLTNWADFLHGAP